MRRTAGRPSRVRARRGQARAASRRASCLRWTPDRARSARFVAPPPAAAPAHDTAGRGTVGPPGRRKLPPQHAPAMFARALPIAVVAFTFGAATLALGAAGCEKLDHENIDKWSHTSKGPARLLQAVTS